MVDFRLCVLPLVLACVSLGCGDDSATSDSASTGSGTGTSTPVTGATTSAADATTEVGDTSRGDATVSADSTATTDPTTTGATDSGTSGDSGTGALPPFDAMCDDESGTGTTGTDDGGLDTSGGGLPDGSACSDDIQCQSTHCFAAGPLGGVCAECTADAHCPDGGCSLGNQIGGSVAACNQGEQGGGCESDEACCGIGLCAVLIAIPNTFPTSSCGQCVTDADCPNPGLCQPDIHLSSFDGLHECVLPGSLPSGHSCTTDDACESEHCVDATLLGTVEIGVCSECRTDADCPGGTCVPPEVSMSDGLVAGTCG